MSLHVDTLSLGLLETNCHIARTEAGDALIVDPGAEPQRVLDHLDEKDLTARAILLTHAHIDHIGAVPKLAEVLDLPVVLHPADRDLYHSPHNALLPWIGPISDPLPSPVDEVDELPSELCFDLLHTPGHSPGGACFHLPAHGVIFVGDTLMCGGVGRTDLPGGDWATLETSIRTVLYTLPEETRCYAGHGPATTIGDEKRHNPFISA